MLAPIHPVEEDGRDGTPIGWGVEVRLAQANCMAHSASYGQAVDAEDVTNDDVGLDHRLTGNAV